MRNPCRHPFWHSKKGSTAIEYAIVLPILLLLIMGIVEYSTVMYGEAILEGATNYAARLAKTGYVNQSTTTGTCPVVSPATTQTQVTFINCIIGTRINGFLNPANLQINAIDYPSGYSTVTGVTHTTCTNTVTNPQTVPLCTSTENMGNSGDIVVFTAQYPWHVITPFLQNVLGSSGIFMLSSSAVVKNEPYTSR